MKKAKKSGKRAPKKQAARRKMKADAAGKWFEKLVILQAKLRAPDGCPWDREQTHMTLRTYLIEEAYEVLEALEELRTYMFQNLYFLPAVRDEFEKAQKLLTAIFEYVTRHPDEFFPGRNDEPIERLAIDFIAGMTDRYAINLYERLFMPRPWT